MAGIFFLIFVCLTGYVLLANGRSIEIENTHIIVNHGNSTLSPGEESLKKHVEHFFDMVFGFLKTGSVIVAVLLFLLIQYLGYKVMKYIGRKSDEKKARKKQSEKIPMEEVSVETPVPHIQKF
ncbi:unnamed protein product [Bursaphelenchus xylophilus]|uniref:(pine wood nematode) hypothetical protein n=1 Tax=Bursaphelenchus xylophilus TaxID=6326 RepID=A0A1I7S2I5_BURXY|nr:unnamed protein product [Bursaphelenchus xylophilus]CAG9121932.1 unnamed protein product [Bursaphelenchus xylophilus]